MKLGRICILVFVLIFGFGCDKSVDTDEELLGLGSGVGGGVGKETLIDMADGSTKRIDKLKIGDMVSSEDGSAREIKKVISGRVNNIYSIYTKSGNRILIVGGQPVKSTAGWITGGELTVGMLINGKNGNETIDRINIQPYNDSIYFLQFDEETAFVANGFVIGDFNISSQLSQGEL